MKTVKASTRFSIVKRSKGESAVEKASYISRESIESGYYGKSFNHTAHEDLVHSEIMLPAHAPKEFMDRATLWNSIEASEKAKDAQLARMVKLSMPNEWSYELATEIMRDYIQRNFVSQGMCADFAINDFVNEKTGDRNLHAHILLTMREIGEDGKWKPKWKKVYELDENGERIKNKKGK